ncbi:hypothetical protein XENTR_v10016443 [Xenopus tropicalis]|uniref:FH1/FH2 domain-containing protein 3 n=1 Tax=Xenopus tropicalis TaxID=8364 RepID=A0A6I8S527_XENTR|nr:FH1/FH2 domain-containing protein 3 [Xenopus tropicalis]KAE8597377.1 hypothetical protein XENTR_v10016443 [Xenopus tropicalis]
MASFECRVQFLDDTDPFNSTNFPEPSRPPLYTFRVDIPLVNQIAGAHRLLKAPQKIDDCALQLSHNSAYLDLESTLEEQQDEMEGFHEDSVRGKKHSIILRTKLSIRVHACIEKLYSYDGRELRRALFSLKQIFQDDKDLVHEFIRADGLKCLVKLGAETDQNYQNYILRALGQIMLYVDGMNGIINNNETVQWLYTLIGSKFRLVVKTSLKLLLVFVEYTETNSLLLTQAVTVSDIKKGVKAWSTIMDILREKDGVDTELLVHMMTLINKTLEYVPDDDLYFNILDCLEELGMESVVKRHLNKKGTDLDLVEQCNTYETTFKYDNGDSDVYNAANIAKRKRMSSHNLQALIHKRSLRQTVENVNKNLPSQAKSCSYLNKCQSKTENINEMHQPSEKSSYFNGNPSALHQDRACLGGLLTSSYRQHQESLAAERERRRQEREERLHKIEREERNKFQQHYLDTREEQRHAREERYKNLEKLAAEEYAQEVKNRNKCNRKEFSSCFIENSSFDKSDYLKTPEDYCCEDNVLSVENMIQSSSFYPSDFSSVQESVMDNSAKSECHVKGELQFRTPTEDNNKDTKDYDCQKQLVDNSTQLSEKEKQYEESNEKDLCSGSSVSSTSSTSERVEKEESSENETVWVENMSNKEDNEFCALGYSSQEVLMLDLLYEDKNICEEQDKETDDEVDESKEETEKDKLLSDLIFSTPVLHSSKVEESIENIDDQNCENFLDEIKSRDTEVSEASRSEPILDITVQSRKDADFMWDQMMANPKELRIKDMDFTELGEDDDFDVLSMDLETKETTNIFPPMPPPPLNCIGLLPPPPLPPSRSLNANPSCVLPPPLPPVSQFCPPVSQFCGSPQLLRKEPIFNKKKKTIRLFWNEVRPFQLQPFHHSRYRDCMWSKLEPINLDTSKLEYLFESKSKDLPVTKKTAGDGKKQEVIVLDSKRSNAINIGLTVLPPPRTIKMAILNFDEYALNKEGIDKILTMIPTEEEKQKIQEAQLASPDIPLGSAEQFLLTLSSISELSARLHLWAFKMDYELMEKEITEPLYDLKEGMNQLENNKTFAYILSTLLATGNFLNGTNAKAFDLSYLQKVPEVKDTVQKQPLLYHMCTIIVEKFPESTDLYSEIGSITRSSKVDFNQLHDNLSNLEKRCKASWDYLKIIAKHEMKSALKQKMSEFLKECAERIIILKIVHRRIINRFHSFLLFMGQPPHSIHEVNIQKFCKNITEFALEYRTSRDRVLQQKQKWADHKERNKTRGKLITDTDEEDDLESGSVLNHSTLKQNSNTTQVEIIKGLHYSEDAAEHENMMAMLKASSKNDGTRAYSRTRSTKGLQFSEDAADHENMMTMLKASSKHGGTGAYSRTRSNKGRLGSHEVSDIACSAADEIMENIVQSANPRASLKERRRSRANRKALRRALESEMTQDEAT